MNLINAVENAKSCKSNGIARCITAGMHIFAKHFLNWEVPQTLVRLITETQQLAAQIVSF